MTSPTSKPVEDNAASKRLNWAIGGMAILFFWTTLSPWLSLLSLGTVARLTGWSGQLEINRPLSWLVFSLFRWLPPDWLPLVLNIITASGAALVLVQLTRSVAILRFDVVSADPMRQKATAQSLLPGPWAWLPPVFAAVALGLQLSFWGHATSASGEMLSVLCFAFAFRGILEYRIDPQEKWLYRSALVYALGLTDNWMMLGYLPVFGAAIIWAKGFGRCLEWRFFWRLAAWSLFGLSLYLVVPVSCFLQAPQQPGFWPPLLAYLTGQKNSLLILQSYSFRLLALTGVLPFLLLAVRWRSHSVQLADDTHAGVFITKASGHFIHALFFAAAIWITLNPLFTPHQTELNATLLVYYYSWALVAGYCAGYLLLFSLPRDRKPPARWPVIIAVSFLVVLPLFLVWKNFSDLRLTNSRALKEFAQQLYEDLPPGRSAALSEEPLPILLLRAEMATRDGAKNPMLINTRLMALPEYRDRMVRNYGARWPETPTTNGATLTLGQMVTLVSRIATNEPLVYLHPSSGLFLETFAGQPHGWLQYLSLRPKREDGNSNLDRPETERRWKRRWDTTLKLRARQFTGNRQHAARWAEADWKFLQLSSQANETALLLGGIYAKTLNHWGVQLRQAGQEDAAQQWFERALTFNPDNLAAHINLETIARGKKGDHSRLTLAWAKEAYPKLIAKFPTWPEVISGNGPVDEPTFLVLSGLMHFNSASPRQARECFTRSMVLAPDWPSPKLGAAQMMNVLGDFADAEALSATVLRQENSLRPPALVQLLKARSAALWRLSQTNAALEFIETFTTRHQDVNEVVNTAADVCAALGRFDMELKWRVLLTQRDPKQVEWLIKQGRAEINGQRYEAAQRTLTSALELLPTSAEARLLRAVATLETGQFDAAHRDYQELLKNPAHTPQALFGLGAMAWRQRDTNAIIQYYRSFLTNSAANSPQAIMATQRLKTLQDE